MVDSPEIRAPVARSRRTNGATHLKPLDGRSRPARRYRDALAAVVAASGAKDDIALQACRVAATCIVTCETFEARLAAGEAPGTKAQLAYVRAAGLLTRTLRKLGIELGTPTPEPKPDRPSLPDPYRNDGSRTVADLVAAPP